MRCLLSVLSFSVLASLAHAGPNDAEWNPPDRYSGAFWGKVVERRLPPKKVQAACNRLFAKYDLDIATSMTQRGCSVVMGDLCEIVIIDRPYLRTTPDAVRRHEIGHCVGWPAHHPE
jgi:hypothetical protein